MTVVYVRLLNIWKNTNKNTESTRHLHFIANVGPRRDGIAGWNRHYSWNERLSKKNIYCYTKQYSQPRMAVTHLGRFSLAPLTRTPKNNYWKKERPSEKRAEKSRQTGDDLVVWSGLKTAIVALWKVLARFPKVLSSQTQKVTSLVSSVSKKTAVKEAGNG